MATHVRHPVLISVSQPNAWTFGILFFFESVARAAMLAVLPLTVYRVFQAKETVSLVYTGVALVALCLSFAIPPLVRRISRRWTYTLGCVLLALFALLVDLGMPVVLVFAMLCRTLGAAMLNITLALYIMDNIEKRDLARSEPLRLAMATVAWGITPYVGVWLMENVGVWAASLLSISASLSLIGVFWAFRLREGGPIRPEARSLTRARDPIQSIRRFVSQPRLRLAWSIAFARSAFWMTFFVYIPILLVEGGWPATASGIAVAAGNLMLFNNLFSGRLAARLSLRRVLGGAFLAAAGLVGLVAVLSAVNPAAAAVVMVAAAFFIALVDGLGPVPFLRAVRTHERARMATVYRTYLDASELLPPLVYSALLPLLGFPGAFAALACLVGGVGVLTLCYLPRGM